MVVVFGIALLLASLLARQLPVAPTLLLVFGVSTGFVPTLCRGQLPQQFANSIDVDGVRWTKLGAGRKALYYRVI